MTAASAPAWRGSALAIGGRQVILSSEAASLALFCVRFYVGTTAGQNGGGSLSAGMRELRDALEIAARAQPLPTLEEEPEPLERAGLITMREAGALLGVTDRQARWLARGDQLGPVYQAGQSNLVQRAEVEALRDRRARVAEDGNPDIRCATEQRQSDVSTRADDLAGTSEGAAAVRARGVFSLSDPSNGTGRGPLVTRAKR